MKEILIKFESEVDYWKFINTIIVPEVIKDKAEFDQENNILIIKKQE